MEYKCSQKFIKKLETEKFEIGSFDVYQDRSLKLLMKNYHLTKEEAEEKQKEMPTTYRAAIQSKKSGEYIGFIGMYEINNPQGETLLMFETEDELPFSDKRDIIKTYKSWLKESLNMKVVNKKQTHEAPKSQIMIPPNYMIQGISDITREKFNEWYTIPRLTKEFTIVDGNNIIGIIGIANLLWANKRADLHLFLDKNLPNNIATELGSKIVDDYVDFLHNSNIYSISSSIDGSENSLLQVFSQSKMQFYAKIPFASQRENTLNSNLLYQHIPHMWIKGQAFSNNISVDMSHLETKKKEIKKIIDLPNGYQLISPSIFDNEGISVQEIVLDHIKALQSRENFAIPLGEDKYMIQEGNGKYGFSKILPTYSYILLNENKKYSGYINIIRNKASMKNAEIEIGIKPDLQQQGLGTMVLEYFYEELFSIGYASITSAVFSFNEPSIQLHEKVAQLNGTRLSSYYINGKLWDMKYYTKVNPLLENQEKYKHYNLSLKR